MNMNNNIQKSDTWIILDLLDNLTLVVKVMLVLNLIQLCIMFVLLGFYYHMI